MGLLHLLCHILTIFVTITIHSTCAYFELQVVSQSEYFRYLDSYTYSYASILSTTTALSVQRCASACKKDPSCDGFYYRRSNIQCLLASGLLRHPTSSVDPMNYRMYLRNSYDLSTQCPTNTGFRIVTAGSKTFCLKVNDNNMGYFAAEFFCQMAGGSLLYLGGDIAGNMQYMDDILNQLGANFHSCWGGAKQRSTGSSEWVWSYGDLDMTQEQYDSYIWSVQSGSMLKCMDIDSIEPHKVKQASCFVPDQSICEIVLF